MRLAFILLFVFILSSCTEPPPPTCEGAECPVLCENVTTAEINVQQPANSFTATTDFKNCYVAGSSANAVFTITPADKANLVADKAIIVFDIIETGSGGGSLITDVIDTNSISAKPNIFEDPLPMSQLQTGINATIGFKFKNGVAAKNYSLVISIFRCNGSDEACKQVTDDITALVGRIFYRFRIER
jgi:hypothetical protein